MSKTVNSKEFTPKSTTRTLEEILKEKYAGFDDISRADMLEATKEYLEQFQKNFQVCKNILSENGQGALAEIEFLIKHLTGTFSNKDKEGEK